jgi:trans-2,3-dihydro-3-hydroxyanthranilate isomerase
MKYKFHIVDVFSQSAFGGNQLAVLPTASGISPEGMQKIAREFNFAETTFVLPAQNAKHTRQVRIFTPKAEVPFAGHPTVGTACALVMSGHVEPGRTLILEEAIGPLSVEVEERAGAFRGTFTLRAKVEQTPATLRAEDLAAALSLAPADVKQAFFASVGLAFCFVQLASRTAVDQAVINKSAWAQYFAAALSPHIFFFAGEPENGAELYARMWAPALGVEEDPATGSVGGKARVRRRHVPALGQARRRHGPAQRDRGGGRQARWHGDGHPGRGRNLLRGDGRNRSAGAVYHLDMRLRCALLRPPSRNG